VYILNAPYLLASAQILAVEARHAGFLNTLQGTPLVPGDQPLNAAYTPTQVVSAAMPYIAGLNGGSLPGYQFVRTPQNDIDIMNYALALEFLEQAFYQINVPKFFP
jgi:hypothetical protein